MGVWVVVVRCVGVWVWCARVGGGVGGRVGKCAQVSLKRGEKGEGAVQLGPSHQPPGVVGTPGEKGSGEAKIKVKKSEAFF